MAPQLKNKVIVVISDLHISAGDLDDFDEELEVFFDDFLNHISNYNQNYNVSVELVINGDFLDFVQSPPWRGTDLRSKTHDDIPLCFTEEQSIKKLKCIFQKHKKIFVALRKFLSREINHLTIIPGNHDVDFFWPKVRNVFSEMILLDRNKGQIKFILERCYIPPDFPKIAIEHGHLFDPCNTFFVNKRMYWSLKSSPIFKDIKGQFRLYECIGTRFLNKFINELDSMYHFVDNVKPFSYFLSIFGASSLIPGYGPFKAAVASWEMLRYLSSTLIDYPSDLLTVKNIKELDPRPILNYIFNRFNDTEYTDFIKILKGIDFKVDIPLQMIAEDIEMAKNLMAYLAENSEVIPDIREESTSYLKIKSESGTLGLFKNLVFDETKQLINSAKQQFKDNNLDLIIMGHTHKPLYKPQRINYINTGCWTRFFHYDADTEIPHSWSLLKNSSYVSFPYQLNYVRIESQNPHSARLIRFKERFNGNR